nr:hypothetical protein [Marinicella sp. W31]MDC2879880.1 hypothetical protein [Marinicella sp. W31]
MTNSVSEQVRKCYVSDEGKWLIPGYEQPRWYTNYRVWVCDPVTGAESDKISFTYSGRSPRLTDLYVSKTTAFGFGPAGTEITVYGPAGQLLGKAFIFGMEGPWSVNFSETLNAGEKSALRRNFRTAITPCRSSETPRPFRSTRAISTGLPARVPVPGNEILLLDAASQNLIAEAKADEHGTWSKSFSKPLEAGTRIDIMRADERGAATAGPTFAVTTENCFSPVIEMAFGTYVGGRANPGQQVNYIHLRYGQQIAAGNAIADQSASWAAEGLDLRRGDCIIATSSIDNGKELRRSTVR